MPKKYTIPGEECVLKNRSSEASTAVFMRLCNVQELLIYNFKTYELRGVKRLKARSSSRSSVGHYNTYTKRGTKNWQLFEDLIKKPIPIKDKKIIPCEILFYSI